MPTQPTLDSVETKIRNHVFAMRIRLVDIFSDYDKLRSGLISAPQFKRGVNAAYDKGVILPLSASEFEVILKHYAVDNALGMIRWRSFVDSIDIVFGENFKTKSHLHGRHEFINANQESIFLDLIERLRLYVKNHGSDVKSWFKDFDKYSNGYVTFNQFKRGIPLNLISSQEEDILLKIYGEPSNGTVNYFKLNKLINRKPARPQEEVPALTQKLNPHLEYDIEHAPVGTEEVLRINSINHQKIAIDSVKDKIKKHVYKNRIRLFEFFRDYDKHNCAYISEAQFLAGIHLSSLHLEKNEVDALLDGYSNKQGRVQYREFCKSIDDVFTTLHLEKNPLANVDHPPREWLNHATNELSPEEEIICLHAIERFKLIVSERRLLLAPFFKDFDKHLGNLGKVTRSHFSRLLSTLKLDVSDEELYILFKKYEDKSQSKVNYMEFIRTVDPQTYILYHQAQKNNESTVNQTNKKSDIIAPIETILRHIQIIVSTKRIRVSEFFRDYDKLRSYSIPRQEFIRGVDTIDCKLMPQDLENLANHFTDPKKVGCCRWKDFEHQIEKGIFGESALESKPSYIPTDVDETLHRNPYLTSGELDSEEQEILDATLSNICKHLQLRQSNLMPFFKSFDQVYPGHGGRTSSSGHVTRTQFRQCLTYMKVQLTDREFDVLCKKWTMNLEHLPVSKTKKDYIQTCNENICYLTFLKELETRMQKENEEATMTKTPVFKSKISNEMSQEEFGQLIFKMKTKVKRERIRVIDFMSDFDHLRHGRISRNEFKRGLKVVFVNLTAFELKSLEEEFACKEDPSMVNYTTFSDCMESVFTRKGLESDPTVEIEQFVPGDEGSSFNVLSHADEIIYQKILNRMSAKVQIRQIDPLSYFEDYDFIKEGTITSNQLRSVLSDVGLGVDDEEIAVLSKRFATSRPLERIDYRAFSYALSKHSGITF